tara:strand:+ start:122 stop:511 length:390 start_codon:yes stop_codon:yes gene_type:complete
MSKQLLTPRIRVVQKLYGHMMNPTEKIVYTKSQYKKFIKDVVQGTIERNDLIEETINKYLNKDINLKRTDKILKIILFCAIFEFLFKHNNPKKVIISEYLKASEYFLENTQVKYLNAILDKIADNLKKA